MSDVCYYAECTKQYESDGDEFGPMLYAVLKIASVCFGPKISESRLNLR